MSEILDTSKSCSTSSATSKAKTLCSDGPGEGDERTFYDEGTIVADDYVDAFNGIVRGVRELVLAVPGLGRGE